MFTMRQQIGQTVNELLERDERLVVVLAEITRQFFSEPSSPQRVINVAIMEQTMISVAAGVAFARFRPSGDGVAGHAGGAVSRRLQVGLQPGWGCSHCGHRLLLLLSSSVKACHATGCYREEDGGALATVVGGLPRAR